MKKVVLAYSGGLDTSVIIPWLKERYGCQVVAMVADVGQEEDLGEVRAKALASGAERVYVEDLREAFVHDYILPAVQAGAVYEEGYLLGTSMARPLIATRQVQIAEREGADALAHGATGKGNDQVRFELTYKALRPDLKVIAPWREWELRSRSDEIRYAQAHGVPVTATAEKPYSIDENLWHTSYEGGVLEDPWNGPDPSMFRRTAAPETAPDRPEEVEIAFHAGVPVALNGRRVELLAFLQELNALAGKHGVGRVDLVENRLVGMKSRGVYETPGGTVWMAAHRALETLVLDRATAHMKAVLAQRYAELVYDGLWYTPLRQALDAFVASTQERVTGEVRLRLFKGSVQVKGRRSPHALYDAEFVTFEEDSVYRQDDAAGFIRLFGLPVEIAARRRVQEGARASTAV
ncbi:argininosuccinate synthase [Limnochorda pilosa]|uniref:Argininosuccinate synthase n=1 Tax=Limnochorda pilosa TaxID=1555112 RepID=A0A0K2SJT2_LIMPI|nr:argininosuccinate synthase [Limnochorda pilosa]